VQPRGRKTLGEGIEEGPAGRKAKPHLLNSTPKPPKKEKLRKKATGIVWDTKIMSREQKPTITKTSRKRQQHKKKTRGVAKKGQQATIHGKRSQGATKKMGNHKVPGARKAGPSRTKGIGATGNGMENKGQIFETRKGIKVLPTNEDEAPVKRVGIDARKRNRDIKQQTPKY